MKVIWIAIIVFIIGMSVQADAGVTIHYSGTVADKTQMNAVLKKAEAYGREHKWKIAKESNQLVLYPAEWCEPIYFQFDGNSLTENFVKTQFAGPTVHKDVIVLFKSLKPLMKSLSVEDEGEFWKTGDYSRLRANIDSVNQMMTQIKAQKTNVKGPTKLPSGRIVDLHE